MRDSTSFRFTYLWSKTNPSQCFPPLILLAALTLAGFAYSPGLGGSHHFDDSHNLEGLSQVVDVRSALDFASQRAGGPLGRPLALASFAPQAYAWPHSPGVFLYTNILLHLLNGVLVVWALYLVGLARGIERERAAWVASASGTIWLLLPLLASSSLLIVQRMTTLAATFLLLGFVGYLYSRRLIERRPQLGLSLMTASIVTGTGLAALAKENGALLPIFILLTEGTVLRSSGTAVPRKLRRAWNTVFLFFPFAALLAYLVLRLDYGESIRVMRDFSPTDRLLTEAHILWEYLYNAFLPATSNLGPFHDAHPVHRDWADPVALLAVSAWIVVACAAVLFRRTVPIFSFCVGWYLIGHSLESTTIPLELYFEHRNYVPLIAPVFGLVTVALAANSWKVLFRSALCTYIALHALVLFNTTSLWGRPALAAEIWAIYNPDSKRATQYLVQQLEATGDYPTARRVLRQYLEKNPNSAGIELQLLGLSCLLEPREAHSELLGRIGTSLTSPRFEHGVFETLRRLYRVAEDEVCDAVTLDTVYALAAIAASNPAYQAVRTASHNLHILMSERAFAQRNLDLTMFHIEAALSARYTISTLTLAVEMLSSAGLHSIAAEFVAEAVSREPLNPIEAAAWRRQIANLQKFLEKSS